MSVNEAITKINTEIERRKSKHITVVGNFLKEYLKRDELAADKILVESKTITGSVKAMRKEASKNKVDGVAVLTDLGVQGINQWLLVKYKAAFLHSK